MLLRDCLIVCVVKESEL